MNTRRRRLNLAELMVVIAIVALGLALVPAAGRWYRSSENPLTRQNVQPAVRTAAPSQGLGPGYERRMPIADSSGIGVLIPTLPRWKPEARLEEIRDIWNGAGYQAIEQIEAKLADDRLPVEARIMNMFMKAALLNYEGEPERSYEELEQLRSFVEQDERLAKKVLGSVIFGQGVSAMIRGENENYLMCRGESSCIFPISPAAVHVNTNGARLAIRHFSEYLEQFPDDLEVCWLLNLTRMILGEYPERVDPRFRLDLSRFLRSEFDIGRFRDVGHLVGVNRYNQAGGAVMEDFDNDGLLDLAVTSYDPTQAMSLYRNTGNSAFEDRSKEAGVTDQLGGLVCYQADYDNDGWMDLFIPRGAWLPVEIRPSLLRNDGCGKFADVTKKAGLLTPVNSNAAAWADYDNDGWVDLFVGCERQYNRLYRNKGDGTFEDVARTAGVEGELTLVCKGCTWIDYDNDGYPDLFLNQVNGDARLYHNNGKGGFTEETISMGVNGPHHGFSCWTWDYDNDGWLDIFATCYDRSMGAVVNGLLGQPHSLYTNRLFRNQEGKKFVDRTADAGLDMVFASMGSNFADFDNDGYLDMYLGAGEPSLAALIPNRMFKNVGGQRFSEITASSGTGHLRKGNGVACGDWDRDGDVDLFVQTGGFVDGDKYHNVLFQNPGSRNHSLTVKLVGKKTNRAALGARIKVVTAGERSLTVHRHVSSGSSFGANTLEQTVGLATATGVDRLEIYWPTSGTTQVFRAVAADQAIEVTEFAQTYRRLSLKPIPYPEATRSSRPVRRAGE